MTSNIKFGEKIIGDDFPVLIIAEIGINHEGDVNVCEEMIHAAARSGADSIKLQTMDPDENYVVGTESYEIFKNSQLSKDQTEKMFDLSRKLGLEPFTTAGDVQTIDWVDKLNPSAHKISSGLFTNIPIIEYTAKKNKPLIMSTGMADWDQIEESILASKNVGNEDIAIFQCTSRYPAPIESLNLSVINVFKEKFSFPAGFSDHSIGHEAAFLSIGAGANLIEKHFSLDCSRPGFDHRLSLEPDSFKVMVDKIRIAEKMLGNSNKKLDRWELESAKKMHRVIVAKQDIEIGDSLSEANLGIKRPIDPTNGIPTKFYNKLIGKKVKKNLVFDEKITKEHITEKLE